MFLHADTYANEQLPQVLPDQDQGLQQAGKSLNEKLCMTANVMHHMA